MTDNLINPDAAGVSPVATTEQTQTTADEAPPKWFKSYMEKVDEKFANVGKDLGKIREKNKSPSAASAAETSSSDGQQSAASASNTTASFSKFADKNFGSDARRYLSTPT